MDITTVNEISKEAFYVGRELSDGIIELYAKEIGVVVHARLGALPVKYYSYKEASRDVINLNGMLEKTEIPFTVYRSVLEKFDMSSK